MIRICRRCNRMIGPDEEYETRYAISESGPGGATNHLHLDCWKTSPAGGTPERRGEAGPHPRTGRP